jgi:hypothetical protein
MKRELVYLLNSPIACSIDDICAVMRHEFRNRELVPDAGVLDAAVLCGSIIRLAFEGTEWCLEDGAHGCYVVR